MTITHEDGGTHEERLDARVKAAKLIEKSQGKTETFIKWLLTLPIRIVLLAFVLSVVVICVGTLAVMFLAAAVFVLVAASCFAVWATAWWFFRPKTFLAHVKEFRQAIK